MIEHINVLSVENMILMQKVYAILLILTVLSA